MTDTTVEKGKFEVHLMEKVRLALRAVYAIFVWYEFVINDQDYSLEMQEQLQEEGNEWLRKIPLWIFAFVMLFVA